MTGPAVVKMKIELYEYQKIAIEKLKPGSILCGGVGSGKSRTSIAYYFTRECQGKINPLTEMKKPKDLYIITTAKKRDSLDWEKECAPFMLSTKRECSINSVMVKVDSWNNISKYTDIQDAVFIFDEQRVIGAGAWVKSFLKITKKNNWLLLSATPGDTWSDYIPVFIANGLYKNRTEFLRRHAVYNSYTKFPKIEKYLETARLTRLRDQLIVVMHYDKKTIAHNKIIITGFDKEVLKAILTKRWNVYTNKPVKTAGELCYLMRKLVNSDPSRIEAVKDILKEQKKVIVFYNFNYELELLRQMTRDLGYPVGEWNGQKHEPIPNANKWVYLVQYTAGAEGWNCVETNTTIFYSQNYSYRIMIQAAGRIDRLNSPFRDLYYFHLRSNSAIDLSIAQAIKKKKNFNILRFMETLPSTASRQEHML